MTINMIALLFFGFILFMSFKAFQNRSKEKKDLNEIVSRGKSSLLMSIVCVTLLVVGLYLGGTYSASNGDVTTMQSRMTNDSSRVLNSIGSIGK